MSKIAQMSFVKNRKYSWWEIGDCSYCNLVAYKVSRFLIKWKQSIKDTDTGLISKKVYWHIIVANISYHTVAGITRYIVKS